MEIDTKFIRKNFLNLSVPFYLLKYERVGDAYSDQQLG